MALNYPGYAVPQPTSTKLTDLLAIFDDQYDKGVALKAEREAPDIFSEWLASMGGGQPQVLSNVAGRPAAPPGAVREGHVIAEAARNPELGGMLESYIANAKAAESGGNPNAKNPRSSATGLYQFTEPTWRDLMRANPELGLTPDGRTDPAQQEAAMRVFTQNNAKVLADAGVGVNPGTLYAAHFLGAVGATKALSYAPETPMMVAAGPEVVAANPFLKDMTVGEFQQWAAEKGGGGNGGYQPPMAPQGAPGSPAPVQAAGNSLPPDDVMRRMFANPITRELAITLAQQAQTGNVTEQPAAVQEYLFAVQNGYEGSYVDFKQSLKDGTTVTVNNGGGTDEYYKKLDTDLAAQNVALIDAGRTAYGNNMRLTQLEQHLANAPQGIEGAITQFVGSLGIPVDGLDDLQAAQALINQMVPGQRPPGSGTMSDADLALFKASLPSIINQPGGNQLIIQTTKAINDYTIALAEIAEKVANREMTPAEGRKEQRAVPNPLADFKAPPKAGASDKAGPVTITNDDAGQQAYEALKPGQPYIAPDGSVRVKGGQ
jgi:hypothetical protein